MPTVDCICREISAAAEGLKRSFAADVADEPNSLDQIVTLMSLLESLLFQAYDLWRADEIKLRSSKGGYDGAGYLHDVMSGVRNTDGMQGKSGAANVYFNLTAADLRIV